MLGGLLQWVAHLFGMWIMNEEEYTGRTKNEREILVCRVGSQAYGTATPASDTDTKGIYVPTKDQLLGMSTFQPCKRYSPDDMSYSLKHFASLASKCVPNVLEMLFCEDEDILFRTTEGDALRFSRDLFLSQKCINPYIGYAQGQIEKANKKPDKRGLGRQAIVRQYGYDTKFASHTIRLLQTAKELLLTGKLKVRRPNADFLLAIRNGHFKKYEEFREFAQSLIEELRAIEAGSDIPIRKEPDLKQINTLVVSLHESYLSNEGCAIASS